MQAMSRRPGKWLLTALVVACNLEGEWAKSLKTVVVPFSANTSSRLAAPVNVRMAP